jgi:hypothetical protein
MWEVNQMPKGVTWMAGYGRLRDEDSFEVDYFLRVETSRGTLQLPGDVTDDGMLVFNWVIFEEDTTVYSTQLFRTITPTSGGFIQEHPVRDKTALSPDEPMYFMEAHECGCFIESPTE